MTWSPDSSITGGTITGYTTPAFTLVDDQAPAVNAKQKTCTALTGTQGTASANTVNEPFTVTFYKPPLQGLPAANPVTGLRGAIPKNPWRIVIRKGGEVASGVAATAVVRINLDIPAGMETYDPDQIKSLVSFMAGLFNEECQDLAETLITGVL